MHNSLRQRHMMPLVGVSGTTKSGVSSIFEPSDKFIFCPVSTFVFRRKLFLICVSIIMFEELPQKHPKDVRISVCKKTWARMRLTRELFSLIVIYLRSEVAQINSFGKHGNVWLTIMSLPHSTYLKSQLERGFKRISVTNQALITRHFFGKNGKKRIFTNFLLNGWFSR